MPDWISHIIIALIISDLFKIKEKSLIVLGSLLPDFILKLYVLDLFFPEMFGLRYPLMPFHSPIGLFLLSFIITPLFRYNYKRTFFLISLGWIFHLIADLTQRHLLIGETFFLFPFSFKTFELGWFWPEQYVFVLIPLVVVCLLVKRLK